MQGKCYVVGIAGGSASGKTTLARALVEYLEGEVPTRRVEVLSVDAFFRADKTQGPTFVSSSQGETLFNFNHPDALDLERLISAITERVEAETAPPTLIVEGLMVLHLSQIRELLNLRLFVELDADVRALRRLLRDMKGGRVSTDPEWIANYYLESARVGHERFVEPSRVHADFIVRGDADFARLAPLLAAMLPARIET